MLSWNPTHTSTHTHAEERLVWQEKLENVSSTKFPLYTHAEKTLKSEYEINKKRLLFTDCCPLPNRLVLWHFGNESMCKSCGAASLGLLCRLKQSPDSCRLCSVRACVCVSVRVFFIYSMFMSCSRFHLFVPLCPLTSVVFMNLHNVECLWAIYSTYTFFFLNGFVEPICCYFFLVSTMTHTSCLYMLTVKYNTQGDFLMWFYSFPETVLSHWKLLCTVQPVKYIM